MRSGTNIFTARLAAATAVAVRHDVVLPDDLGLPFWTYPPMAYPPLLH